MADLHRILERGVLVAQGSERVKDSSTKKKFSLFLETATVQQPKRVDFFLYYFFSHFVAYLLK